jgi:hypothetical protein
MKTTAIPSNRVSQGLCKQVEAVLEEGEAISGFMLELLNRKIEYRKDRQEFVACVVARAAVDVARYLVRTACREFMAAGRTDSARTAGGDCHTRKICSRHCVSLTLRNCFRLHARCYVYAVKPALNLRGGSI